MRVCVGCEISSDMDSLYSLIVFVSQSNYYAGEEGKEATCQCVCVSLSVHSGAGWGQCHPIGCEVARQHCPRERSISAPRYGEYSSRGLRSKSEEGYLLVV